MRILWALLLILLPPTAFSLQNVKKENSIEKKYSISLKDWPMDFATQIIELVPEIAHAEFDLESINALLKKIDKKFNFNKLKLVESTLSTQLLLIGEIFPQIKKISFNGLVDISESDALNLMNLTVSNLLDEEALKLGTEKLSQFYRDLGYRSAQVKHTIISDSTISRSISFDIHKKDQTKLVEVILEGLAPASLQKKIQKSLQRKFHSSTLNQSSLNKISSALRKELSFNGYYLTIVPFPQIIFSSDELSARLLYKLTSTPRYRIGVINAKKFEHTSLEDDLLKLESYYSKDSNMAPDLAEKLKSFYVSEGYPHVNVTFYENKKNDIIYLYLNIEEGPFTKISDFKIVGQFSRDENFYKNKFYDLGSSKTQDNVYIKEDLELTAKNLLISIQNEGFVNAKYSRIFISTERENPANGILIIQLEEGVQIKLADIEYSGVTEANIDAVKAVANFSVGHKLSLLELESVLLDIKNYYQQNGYIEYKLLNEKADLVSYSDDNTQLYLKFDIHEGPKIEVQSIVIEGNTRTKDKLILIELDFESGDILNPAKIEESISRLQRTGHFNSVEITTLEKNTAISARTVLVKVVERDPGVRVLGIGLTDENAGTLHGYAGVAYRNFAGSGIGTSLRSELNYNFADIKYLEKKHTFGFVLPYLFATRARFRTSATRSNTIADIRISKVSEANTAVFSLEQDFTSHITGILSYTVSTYKDHGITNEDELKHKYKSESLVIGSLGPIIDLDYRDNLFNPTKGSFSRFSLEYANESLGNNNVDDFYRITGQTTHYFPFKNTEFIFAQSLRGGYLKDIDSRGEGVPFDKKGFSLGGRTTIRGFESHEFFPTTGTTRDLPASYRLNTSSSYELVKTELRFPIGTEYDLAGAIFYDGGRVRIENVILSNDWRDAAGIGIRYNTPVGPLNLEYAHKLNKKAGESDGAFHLSVGIF